MPVYGKKSIARRNVEKKFHNSSFFRRKKPRLYLNRQFLQPRRITSKIGKGKRELFDAGGWLFNSARLSTVERHVGFKIGEHVQELSRQIQSPVIVDWGCGDGRSISEISKLAPSARCYGFSNQYYAKWKKNEAVKFIHADTGDFFRYFKDNSINLIYTRLGLVHLLGKPFATNYMTKLIAKLSIEGKLILDYCPRETKKELLALESQGIIEIEGRINRAKPTRRETNLVITRKK